MATFMLIVKLNFISLFLRRVKDLKMIETQKNNSA